MKRNEINELIKKELEKTKFNPYGNKNQIYVRNHKEYEICFEKIKKYRIGFEFKINYEMMPKAKANAIKIIIADAKTLGYIKPIETDLDINFNVTAEKFQRTKAHIEELEEQLDNILPWEE